MRLLASQIRYVCVSWPVNPQNMRIMASHSAIHTPIGQSIRYICTFWTVYPLYMRLLASQSAIYAPTDQPIRLQHASTFINTVAWVDQTRVVCAENQTEDSVVWGRCERCSLHLSYTNPKYTCKKLNFLFTLLRRLVYNQFWTLFVYFVLSPIFM